MIKNRTYYEGKRYLVWEQYPYYTGESVLNKIHINLGFIKLVSRVCSSTYNVELISKVAKNQNCVLTWGIFTDNYAEIQEIDLDSYTGVHTPFPRLTFDSGYVSLDDAFRCYNKGWKIAGHGLAKIIENDKHVGYCGYSHRGGCSFKIGDTIFDENFTMDEFHSDFKKYKRKLNRSKYASRIEDVVPFKERGSIIISTLEQAKESAIKISDYLG